MALLNKNKMSGDAAMASDASKPKGTWLQNLGRNKLFWCLSGFAVVLAIAWLWINSTIVATVGGHNITKDDYNEMKPRLEKFYQYTENKEALNDLKRSVINYMVEDKIVEIEAEERGVTASQAEIDKRYKEAVSHYKDEEEYKLKIEAAYGWTPELTKQTLRRQILREQLEPQLLSRRSGRYITVQHLMGGHSVKFTPAEYKARSKEYIEKIHQEIETDGFDKAFNKYRLHEGTDLDSPLIAANEYSWSEKEPGADPKAISAVFAATTTPSLSEMVETKSFFGLFNVDSIGAGDFDTWEDFIASYPTKTYPERVTAWLKGGVNKIATFFGAKPVFAAHCGTTAGCEATRVYGTITDGPTGAGLGGVRVFWNIPPESQTNNPVSCLTSGTHPSCACGPKPPHYTGGWTESPLPFRQDTGPAGSFNFARVDGSDCFLNCKYHQWHINLVKDGYQNHREFVPLANGNTTNYNKPLWPLPATLKVRAQRSDGGGLINGITMNVTGASNITKTTGESGAGTFEVSKNGDSTWEVTAPSTETSDSGQALEYDQAAGSQQGWSNCTSKPTIHRCLRSVNAGNTQEVIAYYKAPTTPLLPTCSPDVHPSVTTGQTATFNASGGNGSYSWSAPGGSFSNSTQSTFSVSYSTVGTKTVTVTSNGQSDSCNVVVSNPSALDCQPPSTTINAGSSATFNAVNGTGGTFVWSVNPTTGVSPSSQSSGSSTFTASFSSQGSFVVTVSNNGQSDTCNVTVNGTSYLTCLTSNGTPSITVNEGQSFTLTAGGSGTVAPYVWLASGASPSSQSGSSMTFSLSYATSGNNKIVNLSSNNGSLQATCNINVNPPGATLSCAPQTQNVVVGSQATFQADRSGSSGTFSWSGGDTPPTKPAGTPATSDIFSSVFNSVGSRTITVSSPGATPSSTTCQINVTAQITQDPEGTTPPGQVEFDQGERAPVY